MTKVQLVFHKAYAVEDGLACEGFSKLVDIDSEFDAFYLEAARVYNQDTQNDNKQFVVENITTNIISHEDNNRLLGKLLTYIDATYIDQEQRKAHKDIVKQVVYDWYNDIRERSKQIVDCYENSK